MKRRFLATDHRATVLEAVATHSAATLRSVLEDCSGPDFSRHAANSMLAQLIKEGLISRTAPFTVRKLSHPDYNYSCSLTEAGLEWLQQGAFDKALPGDCTRRPRKGVRRRNAQQEFPIAAEALLSELLPAMPSTFWDPIALCWAALCGLELGLGPV